MKRIAIRTFSNENTIGSVIIYDISSFVLIPTFSLSFEKDALYKYYVITFAFLPVRVGISKRFKRNQKKYIIKAFKNE